MSKIFLLSFGLFLLCGCVSTQKSAIVDTANAENRTSKITFSNKKLQKQSISSKRKSVSGTFCGDKDISDDF